MAKKFLILAIVLGGVIISSPVFALGDLVKSSDSSTVYYLDGNNIRHPFPTESIYKSWYSSFDGIADLSPKEISKYPLGGNVTLRPGIFIARFATDQNYYAVEPGGILRLIADDSLLLEIYGDDWQKRVVKIPDAFFGDYSIGDPVKHNYELPDGLVYQLGKDGGYFYKDKGIIWPFKNLSAVLDNGIKSTDIVINVTDFNRRKTEISGLDSRLFNPAAVPDKSTADCENKKLKIAFVLTVKEKASAKELEKLSAIQKHLQENFAWATKGLAEVDIDFPVVVLGGDKNLFFRDVDGQDKPDNEVINAFYDKNPDVFDFIILYNNFVLDEPVIAKYLTVTNDFAGTGNAVMHSAFNFGSGGKLKGIANMGNIGKYNTDLGSDLDLSVNYILHELGHHFSGRAKFVDKAGNIRKDLLVNNDFQHWNMYADFVSPLGGNGWQDNSDGTFTSEITLMANQNKKQYSDLDLYFMGLLPKVAIDPISYLVPDKAGEVGNKIAGHLERVTIDQIIAAMGEWRCVLK